MELVGVTGGLIAGRRVWWGWLVILVHSVPWFIYSILRGKPGFIAMSGLWWTINAYNARRWYKETRKRDSK